MMLGKVAPAPLICTCAAAGAAARARASSVMRFMGSRPRGQKVNWAWNSACELADFWAAVGVLWKDTWSQSATRRRFGLCWYETPPITRLWRSLAALVLGSVESNRPIIASFEPVRWYTPNTL